MTKPIRCWSFVIPSFVIAPCLPTITPMSAPQEPLAVLVSGGLDSAVLLGRAARERPAVHPLYVRTGLAWEATELDYLRRFLEAARTPALRPLVVFDLPVR